ncbi:FAD-binding oxidoreductase [Nostoc sp.]|uniref:FAD-binding oxidoreductase n=1 Tax=Nostoc sp. TaxID=1180 RepID=UPI002FF7B3C0
MQNSTPSQNMSNEDFNTAVAQFRAAIGAENVIVDPAEMGFYEERLLPESTERHRAIGALKAHSVEDVQKIVAIANQYKTPLWPISTGGNCGYGSAAPATPGQFVLDLRGMNKIISVDPVLCTALIEPGVTYHQLIDYINKNNLDMWVSFPASVKIGGPVGNTLDRGVGFNRNGEHFANFCGLEVVLANGEVLRTGLGDVGNGSAWQAGRWGFGPWVDGLFSQSNFGIVTKMGLWLMKKPPKSQFFMVAWNDDESFAHGVEVGAALKRDGVVDAGMNAGDSWYAVAQMIKKTDLYSGPGAIPEEVLAKFRADNKTPKFSLTTNLYGTEEEIAAKIAVCKEAFTPTGGMFAMGPEIESDPSIQHAIRQGTGVPDDDELRLLNYKPGPGEAWLSPTVPARRQDVLASLRLTRNIYRKHGFEYIGGFVVNARVADHVIDLIFDKTDPEDTERAYKAFEEGLRENAKLGYGVYRTNTAFMNLAAETYGTAQRAFNKQLKQALDPNGIIAPGKSGIFN